MDKYCDYHNPEWCKRFNGLRNAHYKIKIEGNTLYVIYQATERIPVYKKLFGNIYRKTNEFKRNETSVCALVMCKLKESTLINVLESYGFEIWEK